MELFKSSILRKKKIFEKYVVDVSSIKLGELPLPKFRIVVVVRFMIL